jgi:hypothetical protein
MVFKQIHKLVNSAVGGNRENFDNNKPVTSSDWVSFIIALLILIALQLVVGKFLWNNYLVKAIPIIQPVESIIDVLAISLLYRLLFA